MHVTGIIKTVGLAAAVAALLVLSACSSDSGDDDAAQDASADSSTTTTTPPATTPEATPEPTDAVETEEAPVEETPTPELTPGPSVIDTANTDQASAWQQTLATLGYSVTVDGDFGPGTEEATRQFQTDWDLPVSGVVDQATFDAANFLMSNLPEEEQAAPPAEGEPPPEEQGPEVVDNTENAEQQAARYEQAKTECTDKHGLIMAGPCVAEAMCFDVEPVATATECRRSYWQLWQDNPGAA